MGSINKKIILLTLICSLATSFVGYRYFTSIMNSSSKDVKDIKIIVASTDIPSRVKIDKGMIKEIKVPEDSYITDSVKNKNEIIGKFTKERIFKGEAIPKERLIEDDMAQLALRIPEGERAVSIFVDEIIAVGDLIKPGDYVDIYVTLDEKEVEQKETKVVYPQITKLLLQNIQVLAISKEMNRDGEEKKEAPDNYSLTLSVLPTQGEKLILSESTGRVKVALRPINENKIFDTPGVIRNDLVPENGKLILSK